MSEPPRREVRLDDTATSPLDPLSVFVLEDSLSGAAPPPVPSHSPGRAVDGMGQRVADSARAGSAPGLAIKPSNGDAVALRTDFDHLRELGAQLAGEYQRMAEAGREAGQRSAIAAQTISALEARLRDLTALYDVNARAGHAASKIDGEGAIATSLRAEPAAAPPPPLLDPRPLARAEAMVSRLEQCVVESTARLEQLAQVKSDLERELDRLQRQAHTLKAAIDDNGRQLAVARQAAGARSLALTAPAMVKQTGTVGGRYWQRVSTSVARLGAPKPTPQRRAFRLVCATLIVLVAGAVAMTRTLVTQAQPGSAATPASRRLVTVIRPALPGVALPSAMLSIRIPEPSPARMPSTVDEARASYAAAPPTRVEPDSSPRLMARRDSRSTSAESDRDARDDDGGSDAEGPRVFLGQLAIQSSPSGAVVYVDRQRVGQTPLQLRSVRAGSHVVAVERDGFQRWSRAVLVPADEQTRISAALQPQQTR